MQAYRIPVWKTSPFCRLIIPLIAGIVLQWYLQFSLNAIAVAVACFFLSFFLFYFLGVGLKFRLQSLQGILLLVLISCFAMFITWQKDIRHHAVWYGHLSDDSSFLVLKINEPVTEKEKSYKAEALAESIVTHDKVIPTKGKLFVYFSKDSSVALLHYGDRILIKANLQRIKNSGNPGAFNYERYGAFQQVYYTAYLTAKDWVILKTKKINAVRQFIFSLRSAVISTLRNNIPADKNIVGIAEALLIGYKEDLDRDLVQAYSNTGVVHIIAISGLHLGLIYIMLVWLFDKIPLVNKQKTVKVILILACLWLFSLLTGASASVLRSAVMFTCIMIGKNYFKQSSVYNSLAASAFILLCYDPFLLWDVGFQLSYLAIIGIVVLQKTVEQLLYFKNKWLHKIWMMLSVTLAAQVFTFPVCIFYFHQFPNLFFITNLVAVPLSTLILFAEIFLVAFSWIPFAGLYVGKLTGYLVWFMNAIIQSCNKLPFALLDNIYANLFTTYFLYLFVIGFCGWMITKSKTYFRATLTGLFFFSVFQAFKKAESISQKKLVIYNVPKKQAVDFINGNKYYFLGDSEMNTDGFLKNFHLKPARILFQSTTAAQTIPGLHHQANEWQFFSKKMIVIDSPVHFIPVHLKIKIDILLISKNPTLKIADLLSVFKPSLIVFDSSNSLWKIAFWKKQCLALDLPCFSIPQHGAFILDVE